MKHLTTVDRIGNRLPHSALGSFISLEYLLPTDKNRSWRSRIFLAPCSSIWWVFKKTSAPKKKTCRLVLHTNACHKLIVISRILIFCSKHLPRNWAQAVI